VKTLLFVILSENEESLVISGFEKPNKSGRQESRKVKMRISFPAFLFS